jgi:hypothetical protein
VVSLWWIHGEIVVLVWMIFGADFFPGFEIYFGWVSRKTKATAIIQSLRPSGYATAFGRAECAFQRATIVGLKPNASEKQLQEKQK